MMAAQNEAAGQWIAGYARKSQPSNHSRLILVWAVWTAGTLVSLPARPPLCDETSPSRDDWAMVPVITGHEPSHPQVGLGPAQRAPHAGSQADPRRPVPLGCTRLPNWHVFQRGPDVLGGGHDDRAGTSPPRPPEAHGRGTATLDPHPRRSPRFLLIGFALNLVLSAWLAFVLISAFGRATDRTARTTVISLGIALVILPLCGGSGLVMLPPLVALACGLSLLGMVVRARARRVDASLRAHVLGGVLGHHHALSERLCPAGPPPSRPPRSVPS